MVEKEFSLSGISQIAFTVSALVFFLSFIQIVHGDWFQATFAAYAIFIVFCILFLISVGMMAHRFNGLILGTAGAVFGLITGIIGMVLFISGGFSLPEVPPIDEAIRFHWLMETVSIGGTAILVGLFFIAHHRRVSNTELWIWSGVAYVIAGVVFSLSYSYFFFNWWVFAIPWWRVSISLGSIIVGSIAGAVAFFAGKPVGNSVDKLAEDT